MRHSTMRLLAVCTGVGLGAAGVTTPALADVPGFGVRVTAPATFQADGAAKTLTAVATSEQLRCRKVRWTLLVRGGDVPLERIRVARVEDNGEFPTRVAVNGDTATIVDEQLDPGTLCRNRTVTGRWQIAFSGNDGGEVRFEARAFDAQNTLLTTSSATTEVATRVATSSPSPSRTTASPEPTEDEPTEETDEPTEPADQTRSASALVPASAGDSNVLGPGLIVGGVFFLLGLVLLLRLRSRTRQARRRAATPPTGFYTMP
ncbi:hypothetical protein [Actinoplanes regularis]|uniref:LPXTG-motif cell wall anchor domain-containing protein n=1 Tax=Actinoplanes regularis TaxID=52697 RepID=A0A238ZGM9_9ACTN|nr:hypothetical protein [Actinoplanes regularis]GIE87702.1 hypothetical protein Are01nite_41820 [Actinoplanes regularis]SNR82656.1 hypothetical protein SAMN06264365_10622 [Actinoplanes regularis]